MMNNRSSFHLPTLADPGRRAASLPSRRFGIFLGILGLATALAGCAHRTVNAPAASLNPQQGYRISTTPASAANSDELYVILAFSGGGTRAAAFSYGTLEKLRDTKISWRGQERRLLDEVDIISSVSGGSFTAAYYGLNRDRIFREFPERFLYHNVTSELARRLFNPFYWFKLASSRYDRIDMAADYYDEHIFARKTFADLNAMHARPFIVLNATDLSFVARFEFTQDQFDLLSSDLASYPVARGVAASSAFPGLLNPLTLSNYPGTRRPPWMDDALENRSNSPRDYGNARVAASYLDKERRGFVHLVDGGLSDNLGLRGPATGLFSTQNIWGKNEFSLPQLINSGKIQHLVIVTVNAKPGGDDASPATEKAPGLVSVLSAVAGGPLDNYTDETMNYVRDTLNALRQAGDASKGQLKLPQFYAVELSFQDVKDPAERAYLGKVPTAFNLSRERVDRVRHAAGQLLDESGEFQRLLLDLKNAPASP